MWLQRHQAPGRAAVITEARKQRGRKTEQDTDLRGSTSDLLSLATPQLSPSPSRSNAILSGINQRMTRHQSEAPGSNFLYKHPQTYPEVSSCNSLCSSPSSQSGKRKHHSARQCLGWDFRQGLPATPLPVILSSRCRPVTSTTQGQSRWRSLPTRGLQTVGGSKGAPASWRLATPIFPLSCYSARTTSPS